MLAFLRTKIQRRLHNIWLASGNNRIQKEIAEKVSYMKMPADHNHQLVFEADRRKEERSSSTRRRTERLQGPWIAQVRGRDSEGKKFTESTVLENVSATGLLVNLQYQVPPGRKLLVVFTFLTDAKQNAPVPKVAVRGEVRRIEHNSQTSQHGVGIQFQHHRFL
jgi:hypothetical protein